MGRLPSWFRAIHWVGFVVAALPVVALLLPAQLALLALVPQSALEHSCGGGGWASAGPADEATSTSVLGLWISQPPSQRVFPAAAEPTLCVVALDGLVRRCLLDFFVALGLTASLLGRGIGCCRRVCRRCTHACQTLLPSALQTRFRAAAPRPQVSPLLRRRILLAWGVYGCGTGVITILSCVGTSSWMPLAWPLPRCGLLLALGVAASVGWYRCAEVDADGDESSDAEMSLPSPSAAAVGVGSPAGYLAVGQQVPDAISDQVSLDVEASPERAQQRRPLLDRGMQDSRVSSRRPR